MNCPACQAANEEGAPACRRCGRPFETAFGRGMVLASRYEIQQPLGTGGMGTVYKAYDRVLEESVALKVLRPAIARDAEMAWRFQSEIRLARRVAHRNVCRMFDYGQDGDVRYISMEFIAGTDLRRVVQAQGGLMAEGAFDVALEIAAGLQAIHDEGIVHRDLKSPNIMLDSRGVVRIMDFGISKQTGSQATATGIVIGTPEYMSPEQARGERVGFASDVYALGVVIFELFTGRLPFHGANTLATLYLQVHEPPPLEGPLASGIPASLVPLLRAALAKEPASRPQTARAFADALQQARGNAQASFFTPPSPAVSSPSAPPASEEEPARLSTALDRVIASLGSAPGRLPLLESILASARGLAGAEAGRLCLLAIEPGGGAIVETAVGYRSEELWGMHLEAKQGLALRVAVLGKALRSNDPSKEDGYAPAIDALGSSKPGFLALPLVSGDLRGALLLAGREGGFPPGEGADLLRLARGAAVVLECAQARERTLDAFTHTAELLVSFLEKADLRYPSHSRSVAAYADMITAALGRTEEEQLHVHFAALLHDVGKLGLDPVLLQASHELTAEERRMLQEHVGLGVHLVTPLSPWKELPRIIEAHHERWDGSGYPRGLKANDIPFGARVVAVADAFDAMTSRDPERPAEAVLAELQANAFSQFDPVIVRVLDGEHRRRAALLKR